MYPEDFKYTAEHEWIRVEGDVGVIGVTQYAQDELGDVVFVELPQVGDTFQAGEEMGTIESVKAVSSLYVPLAGEVVGVNEEVGDTPELVNQDPHGKGWLVKLKISDPSQLEGLLDVAKYRELLDAS